MLGDWDSLLLQLALENIKDHNMYRLIVFVTKCMDLQYFRHFHHKVNEDDDEIIVTTMAIL